MIEISKIHKQIGVLIDPDKIALSDIADLVTLINSASPDYILLGGSTMNGSIEPIALEIKKFTDIPLLLFPGDSNQVTPAADGILLLSLISGRNADFLIGQHVNAAKKIIQSGLEVIPTGYILVDGGRQSATQRVSKTCPISQDDVKTIVNTALAGQLLGLKTIYLEAGSGAKNPVNQTIIQEVKHALDIPLIVGGGICSVEQLAMTYEAGADMVVVGNHFESAPQDMIEFCRYVHSFNQ